MKIYKSTRAKNAIEKRYTGLKYMSCTKLENGTYNVLFTDEKTENIHSFICDFSGSMVLVIRHDIGKIQFTAMENIRDELELLNG